jgi:hypothetical protein
MRMLTITSLTMLLLFGTGIIILPVSSYRHPSVLVISRDTKSHFLGLPSHLL